MQEDGPKRPVIATLVKVLLHRRTDRGMELESFTSRCIRRGELHELVTTDHSRTQAGATIDRVGFLGFAEILQAGVIDRGDRLSLNGHAVGTVLGFDTCHFPNHYNILVATDRLRTGSDLGLSPGAVVTFRAERQDLGEPEEGGNGD